MSGETHEAVHRHEAPTSFIRKYIFSLDHKVIGIQYIILALVAVLVGITMSVLMRMNLSWPGTSWPILGTLFPTGAPGGIMNPDFYLSLVTMHGTIMVFFVLTTAPQGGFGNYFLPIQIGAEDMAFPFLNMMSFWVTLVGFIVILAAMGSSSYSPPSLLRVTRRSLTQLWESHWVAPVAPRWDRLGVGPATHL